MNIHLDVMVNSDEENKDINRKAMETKRKSQIKIRFK